MFAGDTSYSESTMLDLAVDGVAPSARDALRTLKKIRALAQERELVYLPTHDPDSAERLARRTAVPAA
jgi:glyoxylase-like metal-dependent hydrolase (beta-lactamase superfamily II)